jgi:hypothetical protein
MNAWAESLPGSAVTADTPLKREFEQHLADCPTLAFRVALSVVRNRADAEDVAQEAIFRAYQKFVHLRDRDRFRACSIVVGVITSREVFKGQPAIITRCASEIRQLTRSSRFCWLFFALV